MLKVNIKHYLILIYSFKIFNINTIIKKSLNIENLTN